MLSHLPSWIVISSEAVANISYSALIPAIIFTFLAFITVLLRLYSRACFSRRIGAEDFLVTAALVLSMAMTGIVGAEFEIDANQIQPADRKPLLETMMKLVYTQSIAYHFAINLVKFSILIQYRSIFWKISRPIVWSCNILFILVLVATSWGVGGVIFLCNPVQKYWKVKVLGSCINPEMHFWSTAVLGIVLDWAIWTLPMPVLGKLSMGMRQKVWLLGVFGLGSFICIVSVLRLVIVHDAAEKGNVTKSGTHALIWSTVEVNTAIICASLLVMKPLFLRFFPGLISDSHSTTTREEANALCRVLTEAELCGPDRDLSKWTRDGLRFHREGSGARESADSSSGGSIKVGIDATPLGWHGKGEETGLDRSNRHDRIH